MSLLVVAVNLHEAAAIIVVVLSILSWFINLVQGNNPDGGARPQKPNAKPPATRNELEALIQELTTEKRKPQPRKESPPPPRPRPDRPRTGPAGNQQRPGSPPPYSPTRPASSAPEQKREQKPRGGSKLGDSVRGHHVGTRVESKVPEEVKTDLPPATATRAAIALPVTQKTVHPMIQLLREPNGVRQAVILNEILQRPKSLRR